MEEPGATPAPEPAPAPTSGPNADTPGSPENTQETGGGNAPPKPRSLAARWGPSWLEPLLLYCLPPLGGALCLLLCLNNPTSDPLQPILGSAIAVLTFGLSFTRCDPKWVGLELIGLTLATYFFMPMEIVLWMAASAMGGGSIAWLLHRSWREADMFMLPPLAIIFSFLFLVWLGSAMDLGPAWEQGAQWLNTQVRPKNGWYELWRDQIIGVHPRLKDLPNEVDLIIRYLFCGIMLVLWFSFLWIGTRIARRIMGPPAYHPRASLIFFKLYPRQILILIAAMIFAILNGLTSVGAFMVMAFPLFVLAGMAMLMAGLGVVIFRAALWRAQGRKGQSRALMVLLVAALLPLLYVGWPVLMLLGLADTWMDVRRLHVLAEPLEREK